MDKRLEKLPPTAIGALLRPCDCIDSRGRKMKPKKGDLEKIGPNIYRWDGWHYIWVGVGPML